MYAVDFDGSNPKSTGSPVFRAGTAMGTMPHPVQRGALMPATACAATGVERDCATGSKPKNSSGASALTVT